MILHSCIKTFVKLLLSGCLIILSSCSFDEPGEKVESYLTLQLKLPENSTSAGESPVGSRAHDENETGIENERKIITLKYFVFKSPTVLEKYDEVDVTSPNNPMWDSQNNALRITLTPGTKDIYCIANWTDGVAGMTALDNTTVTTQAELAAFTRNHNTNMPANPPVMTGKETVTLTGSEQDMSIDLTRQIASVEIMPMISKAMAGMDANISIEGIKFRSMPQRAYLLPNTSGPTFTAWHQSTFDGTSSGRITATTDAEAKQAGMYASKRFYIPEHYGTSTTATQMIIKAKYNGTDTYYRVYLSAPGSFKTPSLGHANYVVERNHIYSYYLTIQGRGDDDESGYTRAESTGGPGVSNITCELEIK